MKVIEIIRNRSKRKVFAAVTSYLYCTDVEAVPAGTGLLITEDCNGAYYSGTIHISEDEFGVGLMDTLFHEDRHYQQDMNDKYSKRDYNIAYQYRPWEVDARRYAFIKTTKLLLQLRSETYNPIKKVALSLVIKKYTEYFRPW